MRGSIGCADRRREARYVSSVCLLCNSAANDVPSGGFENHIKFLGIADSFAIVHDGDKKDPLPWIGKYCRQKCLPLFIRKVPVCLPRFKVGNFLASIGKLLLQPFNFGLSLRLCCFGIALALIVSGGRGNASQSMVSEIVNEGQTLSKEQKPQDNNSRNMQVVGDCLSRINGIPTWEETHIPELLFVWLISLLLTMKLTMLIMRRR